MKKFYIPLIALLLALTVTGCSARSSSYEEEYAVAETMAAAYGAGYYDAVTEEVPQEAKMASAANGSAEYGANESVTPEQTERKLIRNIDISLETENFDEVTGGIVADVEKFGGYIENSNYYLGSYSYENLRSANITVRIPADKADEFLSRSYENTHVTSRNESTEDVSLQYSDLETRLSTLEAERDRLQELIREADDMESIVTLEKRLSEIRYELESIHSSLKNYDNKVDYTTVWFYISEVKKIEPAVEASFGERLKDGFERSSGDLGRGLTDFAVWFLSNILTILFVFALIGLQVLIVLAIVRGAKKRNRAKKQKALEAAKKQAAEEAEKKAK